MKRMRFLLLVLFAAIIPVSYCCFANAQTAFHEPYLRAIELENQGDWSQARKLFLRAAEIQPRPQRRAKGNGPKFVRFYDPYVHLAHCELQLGMYDSARADLELSRNAGITPRAILDELESKLRQASSSGQSPAQSHKLAPTQPKTPSAKTAPVQSAAQTASSSAPAQQKNPAVPAPSQPERRFKMGRRELFAAFLLICITAALMFWFGKRAKPQAGVRTQVSTTQPRPQKPEDTPTQAIDDLRAIPQMPAMPFSGDFTEVKLQAMPLKQSMSSDFGAYTLEGILGRGGMGTTYLARRKRDGLPVAIKIPHDHLLDNEEFGLRFLREGALGSTLHHPNIIRIYEAEKLGSQSYIVMELIEGETLEKKLRRERNLPIPIALEIARNIALALDYARLKGVVHRDLKPDNIMILKRGGLKVMDYGIARIVGSGLTASEAYLGTPSYSAPESTSGKADQQSDLYSLGIILYRMLAGDPPFRSTDALEVLQMHRSMPLPPFPRELQIPDEIFALVGKLTAKDKSERYADAESFLIDLNRVLKNL